jgi:hypothetical protein
VRFEILDQGQGPSWWLYDNDELLAWPGRYYATAVFAHREAERFKAEGAGAMFQIFRSPEGWRWRVALPYEYFTAYSSGAFARPGQARKAIKRIRRGLRQASGL